MKRFIVLSFSLVWVAIQLASGQADVRIIKKDFKLGKEGFKEAWDHVVKGDESYELGGGLYPEALGHYLEALKYNDANPALNYKTGVSSLYGNSPEKALDYFLAAVEADAAIAPDIMLLTGLAYQARGDWGMALDCFNIYSDLTVESGEMDTRVNRYIRECNNAIDMSARKNEAQIINLGVAVNTEYDDYAPVTTLDNTILYFTSRRGVGEGSERNRSDMKFDENIYISTSTGGEWNVSGIAGKTLATELNEGVLQVNDDNSVMYVYSGWSGSGDIFVTRYNKGKWGEPVPVSGAINSQSRETSFCETRSTDERFFTSDRKKGGVGGRDIWYSRRIKKEKWTKPFNLGPVVNSQGNEESVWVSATGDTLWFSSNGHEGAGGYDIFVTYRDGVGNWSQPENLGMPVNSQWDDLFYRPARNRERMAHLYLEQTRWERWS
ncbi:MAG: hypothetical protein R2744_13585 [Bacteroidales bacterium]